MRRSRPILLLAIVALTASLGAAPVAAAPASPVTFTILHTNDFHGQLEEVLATPATSSNPGMARVSTIVNDVRTAVGASNVLLVDAGDEMQGSLLSNLQQGAPTIATFNEMGYVAGTFGNHEFDWGQATLAARTGEADYPYVTANIVVNDTNNCATAGWDTPGFASGPYVISTVGSGASTVNVAFIGVTTTETPIITIASATAGLCFKDPADSIIHYYDQMKSEGADVIVVLSHLGNADGGYGYGIPIYGDGTLAKKLNAAAKPVNLIIGGHSHTNLAAAQVEGSTLITQAHYNGRKVGRADITVSPGGAVNIAWTRLTVNAGNTATPTPVDPVIKGLIETYSGDPDYQALINQEIGWTNVPITRNYDGDSLMGAFVNDAIYGQLNGDSEPANDVDIVFNNSGGLRADITCAAYPCKMTYGMTFTILPFGNQTITGRMTGAQILELLNQAASLNKGAIQVAGIRYKFYNYRTDTDPAPDVTNWKAWSWGAFEPCVIDKTDGSCDPLDLSKTYRIATNEFLAPAGQDNFYAFKYVTDIAYWGDMLNQVNAWASANYTASAPYNGALDGRIGRDGDNATGSIVPVTILHHNDSHGNLYKGQFVGYTQLATLIRQERAYNPERTILLSGGDNIQGDGFSFYFKTAPQGFTADGATIDDAALHMQPLVKAFNALGYDGMTLGNHEFNFGKDVFTSVLGQADFPILGANIADDGRYGLADVGVLPYVMREVGPEGIDIAILGITNHRVPNYELPSNIPGLTFSDPLAKAQELTDAVAATSDAVVALTHIGFTEDPKSVEVDKNVDTNMAMTVTGLDAIIGSHSHTNPASGFGAFKYLPTLVADPDGEPVVINQAYRYNNTLGETFLGFRELADGGYELVSRAGQYLTVGTGVTEDPEIKAIVDPYVALFNGYNNTVIGKTTVPIDATQAYTQETNGANLQADAAIHELETLHGIPVDVHLSGAMANRAAATSGPYPANLKVSDMFTLMPYENSLVVMEMNGPQLKAVLERAYRNYYYYKYVPGYGGYSYYTTCMIDTDAGNQIQYRDTSPALPDGNNVMALLIGGQPVDFADAESYYRVSTVNYLAAGSCNFNNAGATLWPLDQIVADTQYYVRDSVINYVSAMGTVSPAVEGRLMFGDAVPPVVMIDSPVDGMAYLHSESLPVAYSATDNPSGIRSVVIELDGDVITDTMLDLITLALGDHTLSVTATDYYGNTTTESVTFTIEASVGSLGDVVQRMYDVGAIRNAGIVDGLMSKLETAQMYIDAGKTKQAKNALHAFISAVTAQSGKGITPDAATLLITDAQWVIDNL